MTLRDELSGVPSLELPISPLEAGIGEDDQEAAEAFVSLRDKGYAVIDFPARDFDALSDCCAKADR